MFHLKSLIETPPENSRKSLQRSGTKEEIDPPVKETPQNLKNASELLLAESVCVAYGCEAVSK